MKTFLRDKNKLAELALNPDTGKLEVVAVTILPSISQAKRWSRLKCGLGQVRKDSFKTPPNVQPEIVGCKREGRVS
jgi:hypothetical protein